MARIAIGAAALLLLAGFWLTEDALATYIPAVNYQPPKIAFVDQPEMATTEDATITKDGHQYAFTNPFGVGKHPDSKPGCDENTGNPYHCPVAGTSKIVAKLGALNDQLTIDLGSRADTVKQVLFGGTGEDTIEGGPGKQKIKGEEEDDTLFGGPGPDVIDGGPGQDTCDGGPGQDELTHCELSPMR
jgi:hypothetical protein